MAFRKWKNNEEASRAFRKDNSLFDDITQDVALFMYSSGLTDQPSMRFLYDDQGIFEKMFTAHTVNPSMLAFRKMPNDTYLLLCGMHAFGTPIWALYKAAKLKKSISELTPAEIRDLGSDFSETDAYELGLKVLNVPTDSHNKRVIDQVILTAVKTLKEKTGKKCQQPINVKPFMQVLYNAGVTMILGF